MGLLDDVAGGLTAADRRLTAAWDNLAGVWLDGQRRTFEGRFVAPLRADSSAYRRELEALMAVVHRVEREFRR